MFVYFFQLKNCNRLVGLLMDIVCGPRVLVIVLQITETIVQIGVKTPNLAHRLIKTH